jgi:hypothetical protein
MWAILVALGRQLKRNRLLIEKMGTDSALSR